MVEMNTEEKWTDKTLLFNTVVNIQASYAFRTMNFLINELVFCFLNH